MWSHYADGHSGFCLKFNGYDEFFARSQKIDCVKEYPDVNFFTANQWQKTKTMLLTKAIDWAYEEEYRIIDHDEGSGVKYFPTESLSGIIIGCCMGEKNKDKIVEWCANRDPQPKLYQAKPKDKEFGLNILEINY